MRQKGITPQAEKHVIGPLSSRDKGKKTGVALDNNIYIVRKRKIYC